MCSHYSKYESVLGSLPVWVLSVMNTTSEGHYWRRASRIAGEKLGKSSSPKATIKLDKIVKKTTIPGISKLTEGKKQMSTYLKKKKYCWISVRTKRVYCVFVWSCSLHPSSETQVTHTSSFIAREADMIWSKQRKTHAQRHCWKQ